MAAPEKQGQDRVRPTGQSLPQPAVSARLFALSVQTGAQVGQGRHVIGIVGQLALEVGLRDRPAPHANQRGADHRLLRGVLGSLQCGSDALCFGGYGCVGAHGRAPQVRQRRRWVVQAKQQGLPISRRLNVGGGQWSRQGRLQLSRRGCKITALQVQQGQAMVSHRAELRAAGDLLPKPARQIRVAQIRVRLSPVDQNRRIRRVLQLGLPEPLDGSIGPAPFQTGLARSLRCQGHGWVQCFGLGVDVQRPAVFRRVAERVSLGDQIGVRASLGRHGEERRHRDPD